MDVCDETSEAQMSSQNSTRFIVVSSYFPGIDVHWLSTNPRIPVQHASANPVTASLKLAIVEEVSRARETRRPARRRGSAGRGARGK